MPPLERAELELTATIAGQQRTGVFEILGGEDGQATISDQGRTGYLVGGRGTQFLAALSELLGDDDLKRKDLRLDFGGGARVHQLSFQLVEGMTDESGNHPQWGSSSDPNTGPNEHTATGADPRTQEAVFMRYWTVGTFDSRSAATFRWWEHSSSGIYSERSVALESPQFEMVAGNPAVSGQMTLVDTESLDQTGTSEGNDER